MRKSVLAAISFVALFGCEKEATSPLPPLEEAKDKLPAITSTSPATAPTTRVLQAIQDSGMMKAHRQGTNGGRGAITIQSSPDRRAIVQFDLTGISKVATATLSFTVDPVMTKKIAGKAGSTFYVNLVSRCSGAPEWKEGHGFRDKFHCIPPMKKHPVSAARVRARPAGVTWTCPIDPNVQDTKGECTNPWYGAERWMNFTGPHASVHMLNPDGSIATEEEVVLEEEGEENESKEEVEGEENVLGVKLSPPPSLSFDVTSLVKEALACGDTKPSFLVHKDRSTGKAILFSREAHDFLCECEEKDFCDRDYVGPTLTIVE